jgi:hypothetical protein
MNRCYSRVAVIALVAMLRTMSSEAAPITVGGITFPDGVRSFADQVVSYAPGPSTLSPFNDPASALGIPDVVNPGNPIGAVALGLGGTLVLRFTDNSLTTSGNADPDLHVFETGVITEPMLIAIGTDGTNWIPLGTLSGQPTSINIDGVAGVIPGTHYSYVRIIDANAGLSTSPFAGADIDAVGAISSADPVPEPTSLMLLGAGMLALHARSRWRRNKA